MYNAKQLIEYRDAYRIIITIPQPVASEPCLSFLVSDHCISEDAENYPTKQNVCMYLNTTDRDLVKLNMFV